MNSETVVESVKSLILEDGMIMPGETVLVAVSGGADSVCLLHVLNFLSKELGFKICVAHLNHGIRGEEADNDEEYVKELCKAMHAPVFTKTINVLEMAKVQNISVEEAGRIARYEFFNELKSEKKISKIATAHNKNDQAETVLMRIMRGTGTSGLAGIQRMRDDGVIRPLLKTSRDEIESYCTFHDLAYHTDNTNFQNDYTRNRIRNELIPFISEKFNPNIIDALCKLSENTAEDSEFLEAYAKRLYNRINSPLPNKKPTVLHIESLEMVGKAIKSRLVIIAARKAMGESYRLEKKHVDEVLKLCKNHTGTRIDLPNGLVVDNKYGWLEFNNMVINVENLENIKENGFYVEVVPNMSYNIKQAECTITFAIKSADYICMINEIMLDYDKVSKKNLAIRNRIDGDKIAFYNDGRRKKVKKCFIDMKIPKEDRGKIPLLCDGKEVLAIIGNRVSTAYKIDNNTKKALVITYGK